MAVEAWSNSQQNDQKRKKDLEEASTKTNLLMKTLAEEILTVASREAELHHHKESYQNAVLDGVGPSDFLCRRELHCLTVDYLYNSRKISIDNLLDEMQPAVLETEKFESQENWKL